MLNKVGMPRRPEIKPSEFAKALELRADCAIIAFDPQLFGTAANNGQMIAESRRPTTRSTRSSARSRMQRDRQAPRPKRVEADHLEPLMARFLLKKAG